jgi:hypothetical protein
MSIKITEYNLDIQESRRFLAPALRCYSRMLRNKLEIDISCANSYDIVILQSFVRLMVDELVLALNPGFGARLTSHFWSSLINYESV